MKLGTWMTMKSRQELQFFFWLFSIILLNHLSASATNYGSCRTPNRELAQCIPLDECKGLLGLINPNLSTEDRSFLMKSQCGLYEGDKVLVCCTDKDHRMPTEGQPEGVISRGSVRNVRTKGTLPQPPQCGRSLSNRIYGGNMTSIDEFPWMALLQYQKADRSREFNCGGALINDRYILTAAHCTTGRHLQSGYKLVSVRLGEWDTSTNPDCESDIRGMQDCAPPHLDVGIERVIPHPLYNSNTRNHLHDIALVRLARTIPESAFVKPVCLPSDEMLRSDDFYARNVDVAGWGRTEFSSSSQVKLKATLTVWDLEDCKRTYNRQTIAIAPTQLCAGGQDNVDSCRGDSGGPLVAQQRVGRTQVFMLAGVVSFGPNPCGLPGWPGVYTRVGAYMDWISNTIEP